MPSLETPLDPEGGAHYTQCSQAAIAPGSHPEAAATRVILAVTQHKKPPPTGTEASPDDRDLFRRLMAETKPLAVDVVPPRRRKPPPRARFARQDEREVLKESLAADIEEAESHNGDGLHHRHPSVGKKTFRRLARGGFSVQAHIDLHGMTTEEARGALATFIEDCRSRGQTCVRVVHGKGHRSGARGPVLKRKVDLWLRRRDDVLAFVSARQVDGGSGAVYVLLRRAR